MISPSSPVSTRIARRLIAPCACSFISVLLLRSTPVAQLSEVDLTDVDDVRAVVPAQGTDILLHFGNSDFLERYHSYLQHLPEWRQQYPGLSAVDLRYDRQVVLKMADAAQADQAAESAEAGKLAAAQAAASAPLTPKPAQKARHAAPAHKAKAAHAKGKKHAAHWTPHYIAHAGRAQ
jgi:cell division protein FtsQ